MQRYWTVYKGFVRSSLARELEFRANFIAKILQNVMWVVFFYFIIEIIFLNTDSIAGWDRPQALALAAVAMVVGSANFLFCFSLHDIPEQIRRGTLDFVITKPIDSQFWVSTRRFNFNEVGSLTAALALLTYAVLNSRQPVPLDRALAFLVLLVVALVLYYCLSLAMMTLAVYFVRIDNLWVLANTALEVSRFPIDIYASPIRRILTFGVPMAFLASVPVMVLLKEAPLWYAALGVAFASAALVASRWFWKFSLTRYTSASS